MARKQRTKARQVHFKGPLLTVDDAWKNDLRAEMADLGWDQKTLAGKIPVSEGALSNMFKPGDRQIRFKKRIEELIGWTATAQAREILERINRRGTKLDVAELQNVAAIVDSLANKRRTGDG